MASRAAGLLVALAVVSGEPAPARECRGVRLPDSVSVDGSPLRLNGMGVREVTLFGIDVYVAGLYLEHPSRDAAAILASRERRRLVLHFVRAVGRERIRESLTRRIREAAGPDAELGLALDRLEAWIPDVAAGGELAFSDVPGVGLHVEAGGRRRGTVEGADFARRFLANWLGPRPPTPALKAGLLGGPCG